METLIQPSSSDNNEMCKIEVKRISTVAHPMVIHDDSDCPDFVCNDTDVKSSNTDVSIILSSNKKDTINGI